MKKIVFKALVALLPLYSTAQQCVLDTFTMAYPPYDKYLFCVENPIDTITMSSASHAFPSTYIGWAWMNPENVCAGVCFSNGYYIECGVPTKSDTIYGIGVAGFFQSKDLDSVRLVLGLLEPQGYNRATLRDTVDFSNHYVVRSLEVPRYDYAKDEYYYHYPYLYEFYFDTPITVSKETVYLGAHRVVDNRAGRTDMWNIPYAVVIDDVASAAMCTPTINYNYNTRQITNYVSQGRWLALCLLTSPDEPRCPRPGEAPRVACAIADSTDLRWDDLGGDSTCLGLWTLDDTGAVSALYRLIPLGGLDTGAVASGLAVGHYQARLRYKCHHQCPSHDTTLWSDWGPAVQFEVLKSLPEDDTIGIATVEADGATIVPNPTTGRVTVTLPHSHADVELLDLQGRTLLPRHREQSPFTLDLTPYPAGTYILRIDGHPHRLVKQ